MFAVQTDEREEGNDEQGSAGGADEDDGARVLVFWRQACRGEESGTEDYPVGNVVEWSVPDSWFHGCSIAQGGLDVNNAMAGHLRFFAAYMWEIRY